MAANTRTIRRSIASLKLSPNKVPALVTYSQGIVKAMTGNAALPSDAPGAGREWPDTCLVQAFIGAASARLVIANKSPWGSRR